MSKDNYKPSRDGTEVLICSRAW